MVHDCLYIVAHYVGAPHVEKRADIGGHLYGLLPARLKGEGIGNLFQVLPYRSSCRRVQSDEEPLSLFPSLAIRRRFDVRPFLATNFDFRLPGRGAILQLGGFVGENLDVREELLPSKASIAWPNLLTGKGLKWQKYK